MSAILARLLRALRPSDFRVQVVTGRATDFPKARDFAYCETRPRGGTWRIVVAPRLDRQRGDRIEGVLAHELGHALLLHHGADEHTERDADRIAEAVFGVRIGYDADDVQTTRGGRSPRPGYLPQ